MEAKRKIIQDRYRSTEKYKVKAKQYYIERDLKKRFGITIEEYNEMFNKQNGICLICGKHQSEIKKRFAVDHNHETGKIRGLLCGKCNPLLGYADDNINILLSAINYLNNNKE